MGGARDIKGRIKSVRNIQQITKAMKMVASARIKKVETRAKASRPYAYKMKEVVADLMSQVDEVMHPLMEDRAVRRVAVLVVSADKGLCGSYNSNILRLAAHFIRDLPETDELLLVAVGNKAFRYFQKRDFKLEARYTGWSPDFDLAREIATHISELFTSGRVDEVHCVYTRAVSMLVQETRTERILPLKPPEDKGRKMLPYIFEPDPATALQTILPRYLEVLLYQILLEARSSELGARLRAMTNATDNAEKLASELTLEFFRARQAAITNEILEVSSGAEALKK